MSLQVRAAERSSDAGSRGESFVFYGICVCALPIIDSRSHFHSRHTFVSLLVYIARRSCYTAHLHTVHLLLDIYIGLLSWTIAVAIE